MNTITRETLINAIEAGIANAPGLTANERLALRTFGREAESVVFGLFFNKGCQCPAEGAGVTRVRHEEGVPIHVWKFVEALDQYAAAHGVPCAPLTVVNP